MAIFVGNPVSVGVAENGKNVYCGLEMLTAVRDPPPLKPPGSASELKPV